MTFIEYFTGASRFSVSRRLLDVEIDVGELFGDGMKIEKVIDNIGTVLELKRLASAYVIDYRNLTDGEIRDAFKRV